LAVALLADLAVVLLAGVPAGLPAGAGFRATAACFPIGGCLPAVVVFLPTRVAEDFVGAAFRGVAFDAEAPAVARPDACVAGALSRPVEGRADCLGGAEPVDFASVVAVLPAVEAGVDLAGLRAALLLPTALRDVVVAMVRLRSNGSHAPQPRRFTLDNTDRMQAK
jgi:hypothetical protein